VAAGDVGVGVITTSSAASVPPEDAAALVVRTVRYSCSANPLWRQVST
jgi:hypothetical protein